MPNKQEEELLKKFKQIWPGLSWPEEIDSYDKQAYPDFFIKDLKALVKQVNEKAEALTFMETALNIFWQRLETKFKPEIVQKKTKLKAPKLGAIETVDCTACGNTSGIWIEFQELPLVREVHLVCGACQTVLSDRVQIAKGKTALPRAKKEPSLKEVKAKKPTKKAMEEFKSMKITMEKYGVSLADYEQAEQDLYNKVLAWEESNV